MFCGPNSIESLPVEVKDHLINQANEKVRNVQHEQTTNQINKQIIADYGATEWTNRKKPHQKVEDFSKFSLCLS